MIKSAEPDIGKEEIAAVVRVLRQKQLSGRSPVVRDFERAFARYCGVKYAAAINSGSSALLLAVLSLRLPPKSEIVVPDFAYIAVANAVVQAGHKPVFAEVEPDTGNLNPDKIAEKITKKSKAIICVDTYGHPCDMDKINAVARKYKLFVIEDAAESHGALYKGKKAGSLGTLGCFSFFANKIMTTGEGGMVVTNQRKLYEDIAKSRDCYFFHRPPERYWHSAIGYKMCMPAAEAAIGLVQLTRIGGFIKKKRAIAAFYSRALARISGKYGVQLELPVEKKYAKSIFWMYGFKVASHKERNELLVFLNEHGVEARDFFPAIHWQPPYKRKGSFPAAEAIARRGLYLPSGTTLKKRDLETVARSVEEFYRRRKK